MRRAKWIGLTGGLAAGKSHAATFLRQQGVVVIDLDQIGREVSASPEATTFFAHLFGAGRDRREIREILFRSPEKKKAAEAFLHPLIWKAFEKQATQAEADGAPVIVCEAALLIESGHYRHFDELVVITAETATRKARAKQRDQMTDELTEAILAHQVDDKTREQLATVIIPNDGKPAHLEAALQSLVERWKIKG